MEVEAGRGEGADESSKIIKKMLLRVAGGWLQTFKKIY